MCESSQIRIMVGPFCWHGMNAINKVIKTLKIQQSVIPQFASQSGSGSESNLTGLKKSFLPFFWKRGDPFLDRYMQMHMLAHHPPLREAPLRMLSAQMFSLSRAAYCLVFLLALWIHRGTTALVTNNPPLNPTRPTQTHTKHLRYNVKGVKEQGSGQRLEASELLPDPRGRGRGRINKSECGHQGLVHCPSGNVWPRMTQPPTQHRRSGETLLCPKQFPDYPK